MNIGSKDNRLQVALIGLGVGRHHLNTIKSNEFCEVRQICDLSQQKLDEAGAQFPGVALTTNSETAITDPNVDLVIISSYDDYHFDEVMLAIANGKHVFVEKPLCLSTSELSHIHTALITNPSVHLSSNLVLRTTPLFREIGREIHQGLFGKVFFFEADYLWGRKEKLVKGWRTKLDNYSIILGAGVHMVDLVMWLLKKRPIEVSGMGNAIATQSSDLKQNSFAVFLLRFEDGCICKISANGGCIYPHFHALKVFGTEKTTVHDLDFGLQASEPGNSSEIQINRVTEGYPEKKRRPMILNSFIDSIVKVPSTRAIVQTQEVLDVMSVCLAAEQAIRSKNTVRIQYLV
jgi:predicted dehydrogenase